MSVFLVPPGGFAGFSQMTPASRAALGQASGGPARGRRRRKSKSASRPVRSKRARGSKRKGQGRKLKFGSPAWRKKYMKKRRAK